MKAADLSAMLAARMALLAQQVLPGGKRIGSEWVCGDITGKPGRSLSVRLTGPKAGIWSDFGGGGGGDALALVAAVHFRGDVRQAMDWSRKWLGLPANGSGPIAAPIPPPVAPAAPGAAADEAQRRRKAVAPFLAGQERLNGTPAAAYLAARAIDLADLGRQPRCLRFHPACWCAEANRELPALLAAIHDATGQHVATHRTWLAQSPTGRWVKAPVANPKKTLGSYMGGAVRLWRGASGRPLEDVQDGEAVALAEGLETALSVALACPELRVLAAVSLPNLARVILPPAVRQVILCADNDDPGNTAAAAALDRAARRFAEQGRCVRIARSPIGKDFNDCLRGEDPKAHQQGQPA